MTGIRSDRSPTGAILDLGRTVRTVSRAQRRALTARDRGWPGRPGCTVPSLTACHVHHVHWWRHGGRTDLNNLGSL